MYYEFIIREPALKCREKDFLTAIKNMGAAWVRKREDMLAVFIKGEMQKARCARILGKKKFLLKLIPFKNRSNYPSVRQVMSLTDSFFPTANTAETIPQKKQSRFNPGSPLDLITPPQC